MVRFLIRTVVYLAAGAVGLILAAALLDDMTLSANGFLVAVIVFGLAQGLMGPFVTAKALRHASVLMGGIGLVTTFIALLVTDLATDSLQIEGATTWFLATLIVWIASVIATLVIPVLLLKAGIESARERRTR